jgi:vacuole morphology and inheritance protein 14
LANPETEEEIQLTALRWIDNFFEICPEDILPFVPKLLSQVLPAMANDVEQVRLAANRVNTSLMAYIMSLSDEDGKAESSTPSQLQPPSAVAATKDASGSDRRDSLSTRGGKSSARDSGPDRLLVGRGTPVDVRTPTPGVDDRTPSPRPVSDVDYEAAVNALTLQFLNEHEATRVAALQWLIMLHRKAPRRVSLLPLASFLQA